MSASPSLIPDDIVLGARNAELPEELSDPQDYIANINLHLSKTLSSISEIPETLQWDVITPERFAETTKSLSMPRKLGAFWLDITNQALIYSALCAWKWQSMTQSLTRALGAHELISPSLISRSMMELSTSTLMHLREAISVFAAVASNEKPVAADPDQARRLEETLQRAIWGTRIGSARMANKTPLWSQSPYLSQQVEATNLLTGFQKVARDIPDIGPIAFRVYEWLCDLVHPATQGMRVFWKDYDDIAPGHQRFNLQQEGRDDQSFVHALVLWGAGYSAVLLQNTLHALAHELSGVRKRLPTTYQLKGASNPPR